MKTTRFSLSTLLILSVLFFLPSSFAQEYTQWALPEGATMRLGKGYVPEQYLRGNGGISGGMQYSPDGTLLAVASSIGVWLYDTEMYQERALLTGHTDVVTSVCFSTDRRTLASGSWDGTLKLWDVATGTLQRTLPLDGYVTGVRFSPDGRTLAIAIDGGEMGPSLELWDVGTGARRKWLSLENRYDYVLSMDFSPDGQTLASGYKGDDIRLWDVATGTLLRTFKGHTDARYRVHANSVRFSADGETLVSAASLTETRWDMNKFYRIRQWDVASGEPLKEIIVDTDSVFSVCWSADGQTLARGNLDGTIRLWDVETGEPLKILTAHIDAVTSLCWRPDGQLLASASRDGTVRLWDVETGLPRHTFTGHTSSVLSLYWHVDGQTLVCSYDDGKVRLWDEGGKVRLRNVITSVPSQFHSRFEDGRSLSLSADGQLLASANDDTTIRLWDVATGALRHTFAGHTLPISSMCFSAGGRMLASQSWDTTIRLWDVATGTPLKTLGTPRRTASTFPYLVYNNSMDFSPDGQTLAIGYQFLSKNQDVIRLWDVTTGTLRHTLNAHPFGTLSLCFSPDGQTLASGNDDSDAPERAAHTIQLWDASTGELRKTITGQSGPVHSLCWSPDGQTLVSGSGYGGYEGPAADYTFSFWLWDVATGELQRTLIGHTGEVLNVRFSADGQTLASGSADGTVLLWDMAPEILPQKK